MRGQFENETSLKQAENIIRQEARDQLVELNEQQLDMVAGGTKTDKASPNLFSACCNGKHFPTVSI
jgi:type VI protein secretion system component Hcp